MFSSFLGCLCKIRFLILGTSIEYAELDDIKYIKIVDKNDLNYIINLNRERNFRQIHEWFIERNHN